MTQQVVDPFNLLLEIERQCQRQGAEGGEGRRYFSGIGFMLGGERYIVPLEEVAEILRVPAYTKVPGARNWVKGIANIRGTLLPIMELSAFIGRRVAASSRRQRILVVNHDDIQSGLLVDEILGLQHFEKDEEIELQTKENERVSNFLMGGFERGDEQWQVFSLFSLAQHPEFKQVAV